MFRKKKTESFTLVSLSVSSMRNREIYEITDGGDRAAQVSDQHGQVPFSEYQEDCFHDHAEQNYPKSNIAGLFFHRWIQLRHRLSLLINSYRLIYQILFPIAMIPGRVLQEIPYPKKYGQKADFGVKYLY